MMSLSQQQIWLVALGTVYAVMTFYWARASASGREFFATPAGIAPWIAALVMAATTVSGWLALGLPGMVGTSGFAPGMLALGVVLSALIGVVLFKRQWKIGRRYALFSQSALLRFYYSSPGLSLLSAMIALLFAVVFAGAQLAVSGQLLARLSGGGITPVAAIWLLALIVFAYTVVGGMRAIGSIGAIQSVLAGLGILGLACAAIILAGGFGALNGKLALLAAAKDTKGLFQTAGVIHFVAGSEPPFLLSSAWSTTLIFSLSLALVGIATSPLATQLLLSTRNASALAAGQTWITGGVFGLLAIGALVAMGAYGLLHPGEGQPVFSILAQLGVQSPWFMAGLCFCLVAATQVLAGLALVSAANALVNDLYVPSLHPGLEASARILLGRIVVGLLLLLSVLLATLGPAVTARLAALVLPLSLQLFPALLGICWLPKISRQAAVSGAVLGMVVVVLTDRIGIEIMHGLGLHLPWGRWPWTLHSAGWGLIANAACVLIVSVITPQRQKLHRFQEVHAFLDANSSQTIRSRNLKPSAWSAVLAWLFLAIGPGLVIGERTFLLEKGEWALGVPPLWVWGILFWLLGVLLVWLLAYKLELASAPKREIEPLERMPEMPTRQISLRTDRLEHWSWVLVGIGAAITLVAWIFGG